MRQTAQKCRRRADTAWNLQDSYNKMKRILTTLFLSVSLSLCAEAQTLHVVVGQVTYDFPAAQTGDMTYQDGTTLTIMGRTFDWPTSRGCMWTRATCPTTP